jgi:hypothetical protein
MYKNACLLYLLHVSENHFTICREMKKSTQRNEFLWLTKYIVYRIKECVTPLCIYVCMYVYIYIYVPVAKYGFYHESYLFILRIGNILFLFMHPSICAEDLKLTDFLARPRNQICIMNVNSICNINTLTSYNDFQFHLL